MCDCATQCGYGGIDGVADIFIHMKDSRPLLGNSMLASAVANNSVPSRRDSFRVVSISTTMKFIRITQFPTLRG